MKPQGYSDKVLRWAHQPDLPALSQPCQAPQGQAKGDGFRQCSGSLIWGWEGGGGMIRWHLGCPVRSGAPVFFEHAHAHPSNQSLVPCSKVSSVPPLTPGPSTLKINPAGTLKPRTSKPPLTSLDKPFCYPCPQYWLFDFRDIVNLLLTAVPLELLLNFKSS